MWARNRRRFDEWTQGQKWAAGQFEPRAWRSFWKRHALRPADRWLAGLVSSYQQSLESDKPDHSEAAARLMEVAATSRGCWSLILAQAQQEGFVRKTSDGQSLDLSPGVKELAKFLGRRSRPSPSNAERSSDTLDAYLRRRYGAQDADVRATASRHGGGAGQSDDEAQRDRLALAAHGPDGGTEP